MLSWKKFLEAKCGNLEDMEEKLGKDLDGDEEKDEPVAHKKKVFAKFKPKDKEVEEEE